MSDQTNKNRAVSIVGLGDFMRRSPRGFTLMELMMVVGLVLILISLLLPAIQTAREAARRTQCRNNLLQLGIALRSYDDTHRVLPPGCVSPTGPVLTRSAETYRIGWLVQILPYIDRVAIYRQVNFDRPQLSFLEPEELAALQQANEGQQADGNLPGSPVLEPSSDPVSEPGEDIFSGLGMDAMVDSGAVYDNGYSDLLLSRPDSGRRIEIPLLECPSTVITPGSGRFDSRSSYAGCTGSRETPIDADNDGLLYLNSSQSLRRIPDGASTTILAGEHTPTPQGDGWFYGDRETLRCSSSSMSSPLWNQLSQAGVLSSLSFSNLSDMKLEASENPQLAEAYEEAVKEAHLVGSFQNGAHTGFQVLMADGSVRSLHQHVSPEIRRKLGSRNDGSVVSDSSF